MSPSHAFKPKSREISYAHNLFCSSQIALKFCTEHGCITDDEPFVNNWTHWGTKRWPFCSQHSLVWIFLYVDSNCTEICSESPKWTTWQHWIKWRLYTQQATDHFLNQWRYDLLTYVNIIQPQWIDVWWSTLWGDGMGSRLILKLHLRQNADPTTWVWENFKGYYAITQEHRYADNLNLFLSRGPSPFEKGMESCCLVHVGVRDERRVCAIDLSQPHGMRQLFGYATMGQWRHNQLN